MQTYFLLVEEVCGYKELNRGEKKSLFGSNFHFLLEVVSSDD
jgi:hypothetical protein